APYGLGQTVHRESHDPFTRRFKDDGPASLKLGNAALHGHIIARAEEPDPPEPVFQLHSVPPHWQREESCSALIPNACLFVLPEWQSHAFFAWGNDGRG